MKLATCSGIPYSSLDILESRMQYSKLQSLSALGLVLFATSLNAQTIGISGLKVGMTEMETREALLGAQMPLSATRWPQRQSGAPGHIESELRTHDSSNPLHVVLDFNSSSLLYKVSFHAYEAYSEQFDSWRQTLYSRYLTGIQEQTTHGINGGRSLLVCTDKKTKITLTRFRKHTSLFVVSSAAANPDCKEHQQQAANTALYSVPTFGIAVESLTQAPNGKSQTSAGNGGNSIQATKSEDNSESPLKIFERALALSLLMQPERKDALIPNTIRIDVVRNGRIEGAYQATDERGQRIYLRFGSQLDATRVKCIEVPGPTEIFATCQPVPRDVAEANAARIAAKLALGRELAKQGVNSAGRAFRLFQSAWEEGAVEGRDLAAALQRSIERYAAQSRDVGIVDPETRERMEAIGRYNQCIDRAEEEIRHEDKYIANRACRNLKPGRWW